MKINETLRLEPEQMKLIESWKPQVTAVREVFKEQGKITTNFDDYTLAQLLENTQNEFKRLNETTQVANVGTFKRHAFDMITGTIPNLIAKDIVSVQPLKQRLGTVFYLKYVYGSTQGNITAGDTMIDPRTGHQFPDGATNYSASGGNITDEAISLTINTATVLANTEVTRGSVKFYTGTTEVAHDDGDGKIINGATDTILGYIDYTIASVHVINATLAAATTVNYFSARAVQEAPVQANLIDLRVDQEIIEARPRKLRATWSFDAQYDMKQQFGLDLGSELAKVASEEIQFEIDQEIMTDLYNQAAGSISWDSTTPTTGGESEFFHKRTFYNTIVEGKNSIFQATKKAIGNFIVVGIQGLNTIEALGADYYTPNKKNNTPKGPYLAGKLTSGMLVYVNPFYPIDAFLIGYKGTSFLDAGYVYAPYLPIFSTQLIMLEDFQGRQGFATSYGKKMINPNMYVQGTITTT